MTTTNGSQMDLSAFEALLDAYGSDRSRWPGLKRAAADALLVQSGAARERHAEAVALDRLLAEAEEGVNDDVDPALIDRIVAKAALTPRLAATTAASTVKPISGHAALPPRLQMSPRVRGRSDVWRNASLIAASLIVGLFVGQTQLSVYAIPVLETLTNRVIDGESTNLALAEIAVDIGEDE